MRRLVFSLFWCLSALPVWAQQSGWLTRVNPDFAELRTPQGLVQFQLTAPQFSSLNAHGLGSQWRVFLGKQGDLSSSEFLGESTSAQPCLRQLDRLIALLDAQNWSGVSDMLSTKGKLRYAAGALQDYWHVHWLSPAAGDRKLQEMSDSRCVVLVASKGVSFSRYGQPMAAPHKLIFVKEQDWKLESYAQAGQGEWEK